MNLWIRTLQAPEQNVFSFVEPANECSKAVLTVCSAGLWESSKSARGVSSVTALFIIIQIVFFPLHCADIGVDGVKATVGQTAAARDEETPTPCCVFGMFFLHTLVGR